MFKSICLVFPRGFEGLKRYYELEFKAIMDMKESEFASLRFDGKSGTLCSKGGMCENFETAHRDTVIHPPYCPNRAKCSLQNDNVHRMLWNHIEPCATAFKCPLYDDKAHCSTHTHPPRCKEWSSCSSMDNGHLTSSWHPKPCPVGLPCPGMPQHLLTVVIFSIYFIFEFESLGFSLLFKKKKKKKKIKN
jgi:hypothetical protein